MITISREWVYVLREDIDSNEDNQIKVLWDFIEKNWIKLVDDYLPLLDTYAKTLRINWYNVERF